MSRIAFGCCAVFVFAQPAATVWAGDAPARCQVIDLEFTAADSPRDPEFKFGLQMVAWLETPSGQFVDTVFVTQEVGRYGLGNRPGRFDFCSGPAWPYGRRTTTFPVWAHKHGLSFPQVVFRNAADDDLSHPSTQSSREAHYCRPLLHSGFDLAQWDARTCASLAHTDKGILGPGTSLYPPRSDLARMAEDDPSIEMYRMLNPFDAISAATPPAGELAHVSWPAPDGLAAGDYVLWVEVSREFDQNATYSETMYPRPAGIAFGDYGEPYRGQPSVLWKMPITIADGETTATTTDYAGYGDPDGLDGRVRDPDGTISTDVPGSGALRLSLTTSGGQTFRIRATAHPETDTSPPAKPQGLQVTALATSEVTLQFVAPGDDGMSGSVKGYEARFLVGDTVTDANFDAATPLPVVIPPSAPGVQQTFKLTNLLPSTTYSVGIRAIDNCRNASPVATVEIKTLDRKVGEVDACFVATAAYGSIMANDVEALRGFRDRVLRQTALGELAVEAYYAFGPVLAGAIGESDLLRATARGALKPIVDAVRPGQRGR